MCVHLEALSSTATTTGSFPCATDEPELVRMASVRVLPVTGSTTEERSPGGRTPSPSGSCGSTKHVASTIASRGSAVGRWRMCRLPFLGAKETTAALDPFRKEKGHVCVRGKNESAIRSHENARETRIAASDTRTNANGADGEPNRLSDLPRFDPRLIRRAPPGPFPPYRSFQHRYRYLCGRDIDVSDQGFEPDSSVLLAIGRERPSEPSRQSDGSTILEREMVGRIRGPTAARACFSARWPFHPCQEGDDGGSPRSTRHTTRRWSAPFPVQVVRLGLV
eukprot:scaffold155_cov347-Pavlova_lutheri.AAC.26